MKKRGSTKFLIVVLAIVIILIAATNTVFTFAVCFPNLVDAVFPSQNTPEGENQTTSMLTPAEKVESTIISNCIAIIGIAVSVWAGLNIIQVLEKGKLDELRKEVSKYAEERKETNRNKFLALLHGSNDLLSNYLYEQFSAVDEDIVTAEQYFSLGEIESNLCFVVHCHNNGVHYDTRKIVGVVNKLTKMSTKKDTPKVLHEYIVLRKGEFFFYLGYRGETINECCDYYRKALACYYEVFSTLKKSLMHGERLDLLDNNVPFTNYMLNTIGECYSKIIQKEGRNDENEKIALRCYEEIQKNLQNYKSDPMHYREVYFRNYGCLLERIYPKDFGEGRAKTILQLYQSAMDISLKADHVGANVFKVWLSYHHKILDKVLGTYREGKFSCTASKNDCVVYNQELLAFTLKAETYAQIAVDCYPARLEFRKYQAFICRDLCLLYHYVNKHKLSIKYFSKLCDLVNAFERLYIKENQDDFVKQIISQKKELSRYLYKNQRNYKERNYAYGNEIKN